MSLKTDDSEDAEITIKGLDALEIGDWKSPDMQSQEEKAAKAMPLFGEAKEQRAQDRREAASLKVALL